MKLQLWILIGCIVLWAGCMPKWNMSQCREAEIVNTDEIYSTYSLEQKNDNGKQRIKKILINRRKMTDSMFRVVSPLVSETRWPNAIKTAKQRHDLRPKMRQYKGYVLTGFRGKYIVYLPQKENNKDTKGLAPELALTQDIYMIIGKSGVELGDTVMKGYANWKRPKWERFKDMQSAAKPQPKQPMNPKESKPVPMPPSQGEPRPGTIEEDAPRKPR